MPRPFAATLPLPDPASLEEAAAAAPADTACAMAFALARAAAGGGGDSRPLAFAASRAWLRERGRLFGWGAMGLGLAPSRLLRIVVDRETQVLWAMEEALKSGAVAGAVGAVAAPDFLATRRLDFAAQSGRAVAVLLRSGSGVGAPGDLSAARLRWRIAALASAPCPFDPRAPGAARMSCELTRRRGGPLGAWMMEQDNETGGLRVAAGLADHDLVETRRDAAG